MQETFTPPVKRLQLSNIRQERANVKSRSSPTAEPEKKQSPSLHKSIKSGILRLLSPTMTKQSSPCTPITAIQRPRTPGGWFNNFSEGKMVKHLLMDDQEFHDLFLEFAKNEFSSECVLFFDDLMQYRKAEFDKPILFRKLYDKYLIIGSSHEVNLQSKVRETVELFVATGDWSMADGVEDLLEYTAMMNLLDIFTRFELSEIYQTLKFTS